MIKIENTEVFGYDAAIRGMRNPRNSQVMSDSNWRENYDYARCERIYTYHIGEKDLELMKKLVKAGSDHSKFMRMIDVTCDIAAPLYWWKQFDTYKVGTVRNSCSSMHGFAKKEFTLDDFSHEHLYDTALSILKDVIGELNLWRNNYINYNADDWKEENGPVEITKKDIWWQMIQLLPSSYNQRATVQLNYAVLRNMYSSRKNHKLYEWKEFCEWIESLPYSELITM